MEAIATGADPKSLASQFVDHARRWLSDRAGHPRDAVLLVPHARLAAAVSAAWAASAAAGFAPRVETTASWAARCGAWQPGPEDLRFDRGLDTLLARQWLQRTHLRTQAGALAPRLVDRVWSLAGSASAVQPVDRPAWVARLQPVMSVGLDQPLLAPEAALSLLALTWAGASRYATDVLPQEVGRQPGLLLVAWRSAPPDPLAEALMQTMGERATVWSPPEPSWGAVRLHPAADPDDEAQRAAACVLQHLQSGTRPVALVALDRLLVRRVRSLLEGRGVALADESGWRLSTTRVAAVAVGLLRACERDASADAVVDLLKQAPAVAGPAVDALEARLRTLGRGRWCDAASHPALAQDPLAGSWRCLRDRLVAPRPLWQWLLDWREALRVLGLLDALHADAAGQQLLTVLALDDPGLLADWPPAAQRLDLTELIAWASDALEHAYFRPANPPQAAVVALPIEHLPGRDWGAVVLPGCDEVHWPAAPVSRGGLSPAQRRAVGLPTVEDALVVRRRLWRLALAAAPVVDVLWRQSDSQGQAVLPSPLVQALRLEGVGQLATDPRVARTLVPQPATAPAPDARGLPLPAGRLSASAYEDLRRCPYRFFALRLLGLRGIDEIDAEADAGDWGLWVHEVLRRFHLNRRMPSNMQADRAALDAAAEAVTAAQRPHEADFLPYRASWPTLRDAYLRWLAVHEAQGARFELAETEVQRPLGALTLVGRIDRIDRGGPATGGRRLLIDYKTESEQRTRARLRDPGEDTQLPFYCALLGDETVDAGYLSLGSDEVRLFPLAEPAAIRDELLGGIVQDMDAIAAGAPLPPLGEGRVCETCEARGLCRKDSRT